MKNAVILAAGKSTGLAPFTYEKPKGLFRVRNEILIERQIKQLLEAGVKDIYVVIGYMKEKFFYLEDKYGVHLLVNNNFSNNGNIFSLYVARKFLDNTYICCADQYFVNNPFLEENIDNNSYRACAYQKGKFREFAVDYSDANVITGFSVGGCDSMAMVGHAYFNCTFSKRFKTLLESEIDDFGISTMFWEEFYAKHQKELTFYLKEFSINDILEFDNIDDLKQFDSEFLYNIDSKIIMNICNTIKCNPNEIYDIETIQAGLTNVSFSFNIGEKKYVYRHPGGTAGNLVDRQAELYMQNKAKELGIDDSLIYMDVSGWKISYYVEDIVECDFRNNTNQLVKAMDYVRQLHNLEVPKHIKVFDNVAEGKKLMEIASHTKGNLFEEFEDIIKKVEELNEYVERDATANGFKRVLCHNDVYEPNYIATKEGGLYLIDWEYAGLNYPVNDIACILARDKYSEEEVETYLREFFGHDLTETERRHSISYIALCGFYWFCWGLYKGSVGDDDGFFFLPSYRSCKKYVDIALKMFECEV